MNFKYFLKAKKKLFAEYMSAKLEQNHDCVIDIIRKQFMIKPIRNQTQNSDNQNISKLSTAILRLLRNQVRLTLFHV